MGWRALAAAGLLLGSSFIVAACGGEGRIAASLMPDLSDQGLMLMQEGRDPFLPEQQDSYRAIYADRPDATYGVLTAVYVEKNDEVAISTFGVLADALRNPPAVFFGGDAVQVEATPLDVGDESVSYVTKQPDRSGRVIWTDLHRSGRTVLLTQVLGSYDVDHSRFRQLVAERVFAKAPD